MQKKNTTILVVEDDPDDRLLCQEAFREIGFDHHLFFVEDGEEMLDYLLRRGQYESAARSPRPALILLDLNMPRLDGRDALREIKKIHDMRLIPVVVMTTSHSEDDVVHCYDLGVNGYITKPVQFRELVGIIEVIRKYWFEIVELPQRSKALL